MDILEKLFKKYQLSKEEQALFIDMVKDIINHDEFITRSKDPYFHHDDTYLGEHILNDAVVTYILSNKMVKTLMNKYSLNEANIQKHFYNVKTAVIIAMFHDLYSLPWQNSKLNNPNKYFVNAHGFRHPIEAVINAYTWFPQYFESDDVDKIIDGIIHHMYPFPVRTIDQKDLELKNNEYYNQIPLSIKQKIIKSANRYKFYHFGISKSLYLEGKIVSKADKIVSFSKELRSLNSLLACITGRNRKLLK